MSTNTTTAIELPAFRLPMLSRGNVYRAFEIAGDAMLPVASGTVIVGRFIEYKQWAHIKDGTPCIVVSQAVGIEFRRVSVLPNGGVSLRCDNPTYPLCVADKSDILEIWEAMSYVTTSFPMVAPSLDRLAGLVLALQQQVATLDKPAR